MDVGRRYLGRRAELRADQQVSLDESPPPSPLALDSIEALSPRAVKELLSRVSARSAWRRVAASSCPPPGFHIEQVQRWAACLSTNPIISVSRYRSLSLGL